MKKVVSGLASILMIGMVSGTIAHAGSRAHTHIGHVIAGWADTPAKEG